MLTDLPVAAVRYAALLNSAVSQDTPEVGRLIDWEREGVGIYQEMGFESLPWLVQWPHEKALWALPDAEARLAALAEQPCTRDYGSADSVAQVLAQQPYLEASETPYMLTYRTLTRENSPGWRWHKNGPYIGSREPQCEHLSDEPEIDQIIAFDIWEVLPRVESVSGRWRADLDTWLVARMAGQRAPMPTLNE